MTTPGDIALTVQGGGGQWDNFEDVNGYSWDFVVVFKVLDEEAAVDEFQTQWSMKELLRRFGEGGLETKMYYSVQHDEVYCKIRASLTRLQKEADRIDYKMLLDQDQLQSQCARGDPEHNIGPIILEDRMGESPRNPYEYIYAKYDTDESLQSLYAKQEGQGHPFRCVDRLKLMLNIMEAPMQDSGCGLNIHALTTKGAIMALFPLHDRNTKAKLQAEWLTWWAWPWQQPLWLIKNYYGEKIALYFAWLGHYTHWLMGPAFVGFLVFINVSAEGNDPDAATVPYFSAFMALWATFFLEYWKRKNATLAMEWGMVGYEEEEQARPQFEGEWIPSPIDGSNVLYYPPSAKLKKIMVSQAVIFSLVCMVVGAVTGIFVLRKFLTDPPQDENVAIGGNSLGGPIAGLANAVQIQVMNALYGGLARYLNDYENHKTDTQYEDNLIAKTFMFQFVNSYSALFYISFIKNYVGDLCKETCMKELQTQLGTIFVTRLVSGNVAEIGVPKFKSWLEKRKQTQHVETRKQSQAEKEYQLAEYSSQELFDDYAEMIIQFGYVVLFVSAFPLAPAMALANNYVEIRIDGWKICGESRRPLPSGAEDIGTWYTILEIMGTAAVVTNSALVAFTGTYFDDSTNAKRVWFFIIFEHMLIIVKYAFALIVDDVPEDVDMQLERTKFINSKLIDRVADEDEAELLEGNAVQADLTIHDSDE